MATVEEIQAFVEGYEAGKDGYVYRAIRANMLTMGIEEYLAFTDTFNRRTTDQS